MSQPSPAFFKEVYDLKEAALENSPIEDSNINNNRRKIGPLRWGEAWAGWHDTRTERATTDLHDMGWALTLPYKRFESPLGFTSVHIPETDRDDAGTVMRRYLISFSAKSITARTIFLAQHYNREADRAGEDAYNEFGLNVPTVDELDLLILELQRGASGHYTYVPNSGRER
jgi:hypothetical protein